MTDSTAENLHRFESFKKELTLKKAVSKFSNKWPTNSRLPEAFKELVVDNTDQCNTHITKKKKKSQLE